MHHNVLMSMHTLHITVVSKLNSYWYLYIVRIGCDGSFYDSCSHTFTAETADCLGYLSKAVSALEIISDSSFE